jgi:hypothetical protein
MPPPQAIVVVPDASLSTPLPHALSALHSTLQVLEPGPHRTLPEQAPLELQWIWQFCALQLIWLLHESSVAHSTLHSLPAHCTPFGQLDMPVH